MRRAKTPIDGVEIGRPVLVEVWPAPLPPIDLPRARPVGSHGVGIEQVIRELARSFVRQVGAGRARQLLTRMDGPWRPTVRLMASDLLDEGISPAAYVAFVCDGVRRTRGRAPYAAEVFSLKSMSGWLPAYRARGGDRVMRPGYQATDARRREHEERLRACQLPRPTA